MKRSLKPGTLIYPLPVVLVSCGDIDGKYNVMTAGWTGTICSDPPMCYVSIRKERFSYGIIEQHKEFVINLTTEALARATDWCGVKSGRDSDKFHDMHLTPERGQVVKAPLIVESPLSLECKVVDMRDLGSHTMFVAEVVAVDADEKYFDKATDAFQLNSAGLLAYSHGRYYTLGKQLGGFGFSVKKK